MKPTLKPRPNSRPWKLTMMMPGDRLLFETKPGNATKLMQQIGTDAIRVGVRDSLTMSIAFGIEPSSRKLFDIVIVQRKSN